MLHQCIKCGKCCKDIPLFTSEYEMFKYILIAECRWEDNKNSFKFKPQKNLYKLNGQCPFLNKNECMIYGFRPVICKAYPGDNECASSRKINQTEKENE